MASFPIESIREDFPGLAQSINGAPLAYLDNAATAQKPRSVIDAISRHYALDAANIHRGVHQLSQRATDGYEAARARIAEFVGATWPREIVFVRGTTEGINLVASSWGRANLGADDEILITEMEHHSNIVPWQLLSAETGARLVVAPVEDDGSIALDRFADLISERTKLVSIVHVSNALGTINPVAEICRMAREAGARVLLDGAQAAPHTPIDVGALGCDFYTISGHKLFGPTGIGVLWGREELLEAMPPYQGGGDMIRSVSFDGTTYNDLPHKFEAGTPHIAGAIGLGAAVEYVERIGLDAIAAWEDELLRHATERVVEVDGLRIIGTAPQKASVLSFVVDGVHPHDVGTILDQSGVAIRTGHHCTEPLMRRFGVPATSRASFAFYNTPEEADRLVDALNDVVEMFR